MSTMHSQSKPPERRSSGAARFPIIALMVTIPVVLVLVMTYSVVLLGLGLSTQVTAGMTAVVCGLTVWMIGWLTRPGSAPVRALLALLASRAGGALPPEGGAR